jgi:hypothetical protein
MSPLTTRLKFLANSPEPITHDMIRDLLFVSALADAAARVRCVEPPPMPLLPVSALRVPVFAVGDRT